MTDDKKAAGYVRVSTKKQKEEGSHHKQKRRLLKWAKDNDIEIDIYEDIAISGQSEDREEYEKLMENLENYDTVVVRELSRFGRSLKQVLNDISKISEKGISFKSLKEKDIDTDTAMGRAFLQMIGVFNEFWANLARERTLEMIERRREEGKPIGRPQKMTPEMVKEAKELHEINLSYADIARVLKDKYNLDTLSRSTVRRHLVEDKK